MPLDMQNRGQGAPGLFGCYWIQMHSALLLFFFYIYNSRQNKNTAMGEEEKHSVCILSSKTHTFTSWRRDYVGNTKRNPAESMSRRAESESESALCKWKHAKGKGKKKKKKKPMKPRFDSQVMYRRRKKKTREEKKTRTWVWNVRKRSQDAASKHV